MNYTNETFEEAIARAHAKAEQTGQIHFVLSNPNHRTNKFTIANEADYQEFFMMENYQIEYGTDQQSSEADEKLRLALLQAEEDLKCM